MQLPSIVKVDSHGTFIVEQRVILMFPVIWKTKLAGIKMRTKPSVWEDSLSLHREFVFITFLNVTLISFLITNKTFAVAILE